MFTSGFCVVFLYFLHFSSGIVNDLPPYFPHCHRFNPKLSECLINSTEIVRPFLVKGVPELGLPSFDPYQISEINLSHGAQGLSFKAFLKNITIRGLNKYKFTQFDFDVENLQIFCRVTVPKLELQGDSLITGKILIAPIEGQGTFSAGVENTNITVYIKLDTRIKKGVRFLRLSYTNTSVAVASPKAKFEGLFGGNEQLTSITNTAIRENGQEIFEELKPIINQIITNIIEDWLFKAITNKVPFDNLFPTNN